MITELTKEQKELLPEYIEKWNKYGLCTDPADRKMAEAGIEKIYAFKGLEKPVIKWYSNPYEMLLYAAKAHYVYQEKIKNEEMKEYLKIKENYIDLIESVLSEKLNVDKELQGRARQMRKHLCYGQHDADWCAYYEYFREVLGLEEETKELHGFIDIGKSAGWFITFDGYCFISERPCELHLDENGSLHNEDGPALKYPPSEMYPNGFQLFYTHGVVFK